MVAKGITLLALVSSLLGCRTRQITQSSSLSEGWVLIKSKGQNFQMGQEFPGKRWTYTFPVHQVSFTYDFMMAATQVTQAEYKKVAGVNPTKHPGDERRPIDTCRGLRRSLLQCVEPARRVRRGLCYSEVRRNPTNNEMVDLPGLTIDIKKNGYRLLTSAEYEFVVRAGTMTTWFFGDSDADQNLARTPPGAIGTPGTKPPIRWDNSSRTCLAFMTSPATCGCGATTGMTARIPKPRKWTRPARPAARSASGAAARSRTTSTMSVRLITAMAPAAYNFEVGFRIRAHRAMILNPKS